MGVSCPDCCGMLTVHLEGKRGDLVFECRVGHTYTVEELLAAKEDRLDERLWVSYTSLVELVVLLEDLDGPDGPAESRQRFAERLDLARAHAAQLRAVLEENRPVALPGDGSPPDGCGR